MQYCLYTVRTEINTGMISCLAPRAVPADDTKPGISWVTISPRSASYVSIVSGKMKTYTVPFECYYFAHLSLMSHLKSAAKHKPCYCPLELRPNGPHLVCPNGPHPHHATETWTGAISMCIVILFLSLR